MTAKPVLVALATGWGPQHGGINAFNEELVKSLAIVPGAAYEMVCVVPRASTETVDECRTRYGGMRLVSLDEDGKTFSEEAATKIAQLLGIAAEPRRFVWIGHDEISGPLALALRARAAGSRAVLIHHMAYGAYQSVKKGNSASAAEKREAQRALFRDGDLCFAVGPMLKSHLDDLLATLPKRPQVEMLVPGLADPGTYDVALRGTAPENFVAFVAGRLDAGDDRIKQGRLALRGFGRALRDSPETAAIRRSPLLRMCGVSDGDETPLRTLLMNEAQCAVAFDFKPFTDDRSAYFHDLASASVAMMPSWHEGFGLTAWEAIACEVPVVISRESGVFRLLERDCSGAGFGQCVVPIAIDGNLPLSDEEPNHTERDVDTVAAALRNLAGRMPEAKQQAVTLRRNLMMMGKHWAGAAQMFLGAIAKQFGVSMTGKVAVAKPSKRRSKGTRSARSDASIPEFLRLPAPRPWDPKTGTPAALLVARDEIVRFDPEREPFLDRMLQWARREVPLSARLLFGPGGMGKTRLGIELARRLERAGWMSLWLSSKLPDDWIEAWRATLQRQRRPLLLVIDYAESRPPAVIAALGELLDRLRAQPDAPPCRLLLLARSGALEETLPRQKDCADELAAWWRASIETDEVPPWSSNIDARAESYRRALEDYAAAMGRAAPSNAYVPPLGDEVFARPLYLHLAALAALDGRRPEGADALLQGQVLREWKDWLGTQGDEVATYDAWADALAFVVLCQGSDVHRVRAALDSLGALAPNLPDALWRSYPAGAGIAPLEPDLIAEALLRERLAGRRGSALLDLVLADEDRVAAAIAVIARLAARTSARAPGELPSWTRTLAEALARHWPDHANEWVAVAHRAEPGLGNVLAAAWQHLDEPVRANMARALVLPDYSTNLLDLTVAVRREQARTAPDPATRAAALNDLSVALSYFGDGGSREEALGCARASVNIFRELAESEPVVYLPGLAASLNTLANRLSKRGDGGSREEALGCARESVRIRRELAESQPAAYLPNLAMSLHNLASLLSERGDAGSREEARGCARESVRIYRSLAESQPASSLPYLAASLNNLANRLSERGDGGSREEALSCAHQSVKIYGELAESQPAAYLPDLAMSLNNLASLLSERGDAGSRKDALGCARESVRIRRELAESQPAAYLPDLAMSLNTLAPLLSERGEAGSREEALGCVRESVRIYGELAESQPAAYLPNLAASLNTLATLLSERGDAGSREEALGCARESVRIYGELAQSQPAAYLPDLAVSLDTLATVLSERGDGGSREEAFGCAREAVRIFATFHASMPAAFERRLDIALKNLARIAGENGRDPEEELKAALEGLS